jgi:N-acetylmuramoyl-L-alanine amidase
MRRWPWLLGFGLLFAGGLAAGWAIGSPGDKRAERRPPSAQRRPHHRDGPSREIHRAEVEVEAARSRDSAVDGHPGAPAEAPVASIEPLAGLTVVVDPGHNGGNASHPEAIDRPVVSAADGTTKPCNTTGTETNDGLLTEAEFNFEVGQVLRRLLVRRGATVVMTRDSNSGVGPCVNERAEIANRAGAAALISIHADGNESPGARGFDVIHALPGEMIEPSLARPSSFLASDLRDALVDAGIPPANYVGTDGLDAREDLGGLNLARVPAVLVELGNMRSSEEAIELESPNYRSGLARALASGLTEFLKEAQS